MVFSNANEYAEDKSWLDDYIVALLANEVEWPMWWENIKEPELVGI